MEENKNLQSLENGNKETVYEETFENLDLEFLSDISLHVNVEVGRTSKMFLDILKMKEGDIIKLDKNIEEYIDIYINGKHFAIGEMVIVNDKYSVRVIDLV